MAQIKERKKVEELLKLEKDVQKIWDDNKAFESNALSNKYAFNFKYI